MHARTHRHTYIIYLYRAAQPLNLNLGFMGEVRSTCWSPKPGHLAHRAFNCFYEESPKSNYKNACTRNPQSQTVKMCVREISKVKLENCLCEKSPKSNYKHLCTRNLQSQTINCFLGGILQFVVKSQTGRCPRLAATKPAQPQSE